MNIKYLISGSAIFEPERFYISFSKRTVKLSHKECMVLEALSKQHHEVVSRSHLIETIWGKNYVADANLNKTILLLRRKFESNGMPNIIETIPRVGYLLNVGVEVLNEQLNEIPTGLEPPTQRNEEQSPQKNKSINRWSLHGVVVAASLVALIFFLFTRETVESHKNVNIEATMVYQGDGNLSYSTNKSYQKQLLVKTASLIKRIDKKLSYISLLSPKLFSFVLFFDGHVVGQKDFFIKDGLDLQSQLTCIDQFVSSNISPSRFYEKFNSKILLGMQYHTINFYTYCDTPSPEFLAELNTKSIIVSESKHDNKMTLINTTLTTPNGVVVFDIERYMLQLGDFLRNDKIRLIQKNFNSKNINIDLIHQKKEFAMLFAGLTKDETNIQKNSFKQVAYISDILGGYLFYINKSSKK